MKKFLTAFAALFGLAATISAQGPIVETYPPVVQQSSKDIVITYHADRGSAGLKGVTEGVYAHTGVITDKSKDDSDWKHAPSKWGDNDPKYALEYKGDNLWTLNIGDLKTYYGLADGETVLKMAFVFRNEDCSKEGKTEKGGDIYAEVYEDGFAMDVVLNPAPGIVIGNTTVAYTINLTDKAAVTVNFDGKESKFNDQYTISNSVEITEKGDHTLTISADNGSETIVREFAYLYVPDAVQADYPGGTPRMGAVENADGSVTFCLAAPMKENVVIVGAWDDYKALGSRVMNYQDYEGNRYFWTTIEGLDRNTYYPYYYVIDGKLKVADPYAKLVLDVYQDKWLGDVWEDMPKYPYDLFEDTMLAVYHGAADDYDWEVKDFQIPDHSSLVIYEMLFRDFTKEGTIKAAHSYFSYLHTLGVNAVELMPVMEFNGNNSWGYNTNFYFALDKAYGSPDDLRAFIDLCHKNGIAVILDIVFNQSDGLHPWYQMYDRQSNPFYNDKAPHDYSVLNDWRQENPLVKQQFDDALRYWMTAYNVDGFRFDLVKGLGDNDSYKSGTEAYNESRVLRMKNFHDVIRSVKPNGIHINEHLAGAKEENEMADDGQLNWANVNNASCQVAMGYKSDSDLSRFYAPLDSKRNWGSTVSYAESHDEQRMAYKQTQWGVSNAVKTNWQTRCERLGTVAAAMLMAPGPKMIWQFSELANDESTKKSDGGNNTDRKKQWWHMLDVEPISALYDNYKEMIGLRRLNPDLFTEDAEVVVNYSGWDNGRYMVLRNGKREAALLYNAMDNGEITVGAPVKNIDNSNLQVLTATFGFEPKASVADGTLSVTIPAGHFVVVGSADLSGIEGIVADNGTTPGFNVIGGYGEIIVAGEYSNAVAYDLSGRRQASLRVTPGIYVVNVDGTATKVLVK